MKTLMLAAVAAVTLAACSGPTVSGANETAQALPGQPRVVMPVGPYDNTGNSLGGRSAGTYGGN
jgi:hypothetical protein